MKRQQALRTGKKFNRRHRVQNAARRVRRMLQAEGWFVSAAPRHLPFNLIALSPGGIRFVCIKCGGTQSLSNWETETLHVVRNLLPPARKELWIFPKGGCVPKIEVLS